ncbi:MAG: glycosyltransferase [Deltaproteobacteria bacterium]|nr:glycosyltransferase [Deltaproteobacteria bacterium]
MQEKLTWWQALLVASSVGTAALAAYSTFKAKEAAQTVLRSLEGPPDRKVSGPLVSVVIPTWNEAEYLANLLTSLQNQTYEPFEIIVADWSSTDGTREVAASFGAIVVDIPERGVGPARNAGAAVASGDFLLFLDADTILQPTLIEDLMMELLATGALLAHPRIVCYEDGIYPTVRWIWNTFSPHSYTTRAVLVRREAFDAVGGYKNVWREDLLLGKEISDLFGSEAIAYLPWAFCGTSTRRERAIQTGRMAATRAAKFGEWPEFPAVRDGIYY